MTLEGQHIELKPVAPEYAEAIVEAGRGLDWAWMSARLVDLDSVRSWIEATQALQERGEEYTFVVRELATEKIVGSTRYMDTQPKNKGTEIGWTWYSPRVWGTVVNPECKFLLLRNAFEDWDAIRVQLKTDDENTHSQRAILKLGAKFEGRLRNHRFRFDGTIRDTMMYSITREEWPEVKASLQRRIELCKN